MKIFGFILILLGVLFLFLVLTKRYISPYKLYILFGKKGVGKSTLLQKLAVYYSKRGYRVYCNIGDSSLSCAIPIDISLLPSLSSNYSTLRTSLDEDTIAFLEGCGLKSKNPQLSCRKNQKGGLFVKVKDKVLYEGKDFVLPHSVILCDEINLLWDNRDFKAFPKDLQKYFRLQRHYKHIFIGFSQTYDCDKKIRDLADELIIVSRSLRVFIWGKSYVKKTVVVSPTTNSTTDVAKMTDDFKSVGLISNIFSPFKAFLPYWVKKHNSFKS